MTYVSKWEEEDWLFLYNLPVTPSATVHGQVLRVNWGVPQPEERSCSVVWWYGTETKMICFTFVHRGRQNEDNIKVPRSSFKYTFRALKLVCFHFMQIYTFTLLPFRHKYCTFFFLYIYKLITFKTPQAVKWNIHIYAPVIIIKEQQIW